MEKKFYLEKQVSIAAFIGGPIPPGLLIAKNYQSLGKRKQANIAFAATFILTALFFYGMFQIPSETLDKIPNFLFSAVYSAFVYLFYHTYLRKDIANAMADGATKASNWSVAGISLIGLLLTLVLIFGFAVDQPFYEGEVMNVNGNDLYFSPNGIHGDHISTLIDKFQQVGFFGPDYDNTAKIELIDNEYYITMLVDQELWSDQEIISSITSMKWILEVEFGKPTHVRLESVSISGRSTFKDIDK